MKLREFYENSGVDYDSFLHRLMGKESLIEKYINIFIADPTYTELSRAVAEKDYDLIGKKAHTLKGISLNLDFEKLSNLCVTMIDSIHTGNTLSIQAQFDQLKLEYERIIFELKN